MNRKLLLSMLALVLVTALAAASCDSSNNGGEGTSGPGVPTQLAPSPAASPTREEPIDTIIEKLVGIHSPSHIFDKHYYTDSSGTEWVGFGVEIIYEGGYELPIGVVKRVPGGEWELASLGTGPASNAVPDDVKKGLGIDY